MPTLPQESLREETQPPQERFVRRDDRIQHDTYEVMSDKSGDFEQNLKNLSGMDVTIATLHWHGKTLSQALAKLRAGTLTPAGLAASKEYVANMLVKAERLIARKTTQVERMRQRTGITRVFGVTRSNRLWVDCKSNLNRAIEARDALKQISDNLTNYRPAAPGTKRQGTIIGGKVRDATLGGLIASAAGEDPLIGVFLGGLLGGDADEEVEDAAK